MSRKGSVTTSDYIEWDSMLNLIHRLYRDGEYRMSLLISCGCFFGLRISDLRLLTWGQLLGGQERNIVLTEIKTGKRREIPINGELFEHITDCYRAMGEPPTDTPAFMGQCSHILSTQYINRKLKDIRTKYGLKVRHFSTHSFRKTFGRRVVENAGTASEMALIKLSEIFNHSSPMVTRRYLGLRKQELTDIYTSL